MGNFNFSSGMSHRHREHPEGSSSVSCSLGEDETWRTEGEREETAKKGARIAVPNRAWARRRWSGLHHGYNILLGDKISCGEGSVTFFFG